MDSKISEPIKINWPEIKKQEEKNAEEKKPGPLIPKIEVKKDETPIKIVFPELKEEVKEKLEAKKEESKFKKAEIGIQKIPPVKIERRREDGTIFDDDEELALDLTELMFNDVPQVIESEIPDRDPKLIAKFAKRLARSCKRRGWSLQKYYEEFYLDAVDLAIMGAGMTQGIIKDYRKLKIEKAKKEKTREIDEIQKSGDKKKGEKDEKDLKLDAFGIKPGVIEEKIS